MNHASGKPGGPRGGARAAVALSALLVACGALVLCSPARVAAAAGGACVGARALAMGGAFVAVADDASASYWNPAGLLQLESPEITLTSVLVGEGGLNYELFGAYAVPEGRSGAGAISFVSTNLEVDGPFGLLRLPGSWYVYSYASRTRDTARPVFWGLNLRYESYASEGDDGLGAWAAGLDLGLLYFPSFPSRKVSVGVLVQDAVGSQLVWNTGATTQRRLNLRPGVAFRPDDRTCISAELYDLTSANGGLTFRAGFERKLGAGLALRFGLTGLTGVADGAGGLSATLSNAAFTWGAGWSYGGLSVDYCHLGQALDGGPGLGGVHELGITFKM